MPKNCKGNGGLKWLLAGAFIGGVLLAVGIMATAKATDTPEFCVSCHAMNEATWTHKNSTHAKIACNECHAPHSLLRKMSFKARMAFKDVTSTVTGNIPHNIEVSKEMQDVIKENCRRCHYATTMNVGAMSAKEYCTDCHRTIPHTQKAPINTRRAGDV